MPALYTHYRFGKAVAATLPPTFSEIVSEHSEAFALGTQGPDILFYHKPLQKNDIRGLGTALHDVSPKAFFQRAVCRLQYAKQANEGYFRALSAYLYGFLSHFVLDVFCHPYIEARTSGTFTHGKIESELDKYTLRADGLPIRGYNAASPLTDNALAVQAAADILDVQPSAVRRSIKSIRKINGWFSCKHELFHHIAHGFLKIAGMERKFGDMFLHKKDDERFAGMGEVFEEKICEALPAASALIAEFAACIENENNLDNPLYGYNYNGVLQEKNV